MERIRELIESTARRVFERTGGLIEYEEHILLPHYGGNIVLRFRLNRAETSKPELDELEARLYELIPEGFFADFMGGTYRAAGYSFADLDAKAARCAEAYRGETIPESPFRAEVDERLRGLLRAAGLGEDREAWEIQEGDEPALLLLGEANRSIGSFTAGGVRFDLLTAERTACECLMKAMTFAKRNRISLMRAVERA